MLKTTPKRLIEDKDLDEKTLEWVIALLEKRVNGFWIDLQMGHVQRVADGIAKKYIDENQALIVVDHLMRLRSYEEMAADLRLRLQDLKRLKAEQFRKQG